MSGMRGSLILLILLVSVVSWIFFLPSDSVVAPGTDESGDDNQPADSSSVTQTSDLNPIGVEKPIDPPKQNQTKQNQEAQVGEVSDPNPSEADGSKTELTVRVLSAKGQVLPMGSGTALLRNGGTEILSSESPEVVDGSDLAAGGGEFPIHKIPSLRGAWIVDSTEQGTPEGSGGQGVTGKALIRVDRLTLLRPQDLEQRPLLVIPAETPLPQGSRLRVQVIGDGRILDGGILKVEGPFNTWVYPLQSRQWYAGLLKVQITWSWEAATDSRHDQILALRGDQFSDQDWTWDGVLSVDTAEEAQRQGELIRRWYKRALDEVEMTRDLLLVAGAHARGKRARLVRDDDRMGRLLTHPLAPVLDDLGRGENFDEKRWRQLIDEDLPERWKPWVEEGAIPWPDRYPGPARNIPLLFHTLVKYSRLESTVIYLALGKERHRNDFVADFDWDPATERTQTLGKLRNFINAIREKLAELDN
ncbi:MAG: hypothetical protein CBC13_05220 [Planctomycetia bacterium TMED53]|nr:MAG: hypothetical protein CBC13_05220 [Planctomycetia bacterium TMED53]